MRKVLLWMDGLGKVFLWAGGLWKVFLWAGGLWKVFLWVGGLWKAIPWVDRCKEIYPLDLVQTSRTEPQRCICRPVKSRVLQCPHLLAVVWSVPRPR